MNMLFNQHLFSYCNDVSKTQLTSLKWASKASDPSNSPYRSIQGILLEYFKQCAQNLTHLSEVATYFK